MSVTFGLSYIMLLDQYMTNILLLMSIYLMLILCDFMLLLLIPVRVANLTFGISSLNYYYYQAITMVAFNKCW